MLNIIFQYEIAEVDAACRFAEFLQDFATVVRKVSGNHRGGRTAYQIY
jgi:hypothetical protein